MLTIVFFVFLFLVCFFVFVVLLRQLQKSDVIEKKININIQKDKVKKIKNLDIGEVKRDKEVLDEFNNL